MCIIPYLFAQCQNCPESNETQALDSSKAALEQIAHMLGAIKDFF